MTAIEASTSHLTCAMLTIGLLAACGDTDPATAPDAAMAAAAATATPAAAIPINTWVRRANLLRIERFGLVSATVPNAAGQPILYVIGGATTDAGDANFIPEALGTVQAYNPATDTWSNRRKLPIPLYHANAPGVINGKIYVSGGQLLGEKHYRASLYVYDPQADTWTQKRDMPVSTRSGVTGVFGGRLYVAACPFADECSEFDPVTVYRYDPGTDQWATLATSPVGLFFSMGGPIGGKLYVVGGTEGALAVYDPATNTWQTRAPLPGGSRWEAGNLAFNARLYLIGGRSSSQGLVRTVSVYDPATNTWSEKAPLPRDWNNVTASRVVVGGQARIEVVGGLRPGNNLQLAP
jgi:N-acetylneuraminic acid mutarotase